MSHIRHLCQVVEKKSVDVIPGWNDVKGLSGLNYSFFYLSAPFIGGFHAISGDTNNNGEMNKLLVDKQSELMSDLLFTVHQHGGDDVT